MSHDPNLEDGGNAIYVGRGGLGGGLGGGGSGVGGEEEEQARSISSTEPFLCYAILRE